MSKIEWTDKTWNPVVGCSVVSPGCTNCYAMRTAARIVAMNIGRHAPHAPTPGEIPASHYYGLTQPSKAGPVWTGRVSLAPEHVLLAPLKRRKPTVYFVNSMGDLFHEAVPNAWIDRVFAVMALAPQHQFVVLTKRAKRMREYMTNGALYDRVLRAAEPLRAERGELCRIPISNPANVAFWPQLVLGVSVERQPEADERIPELLATPAAKHIVSLEPLLGEVDLEVAWYGESALDGECWGECAWCKQGFPPLHNCQEGRQSNAVANKGRSGLDGVIIGGESGPGARPMQIEWALSVRDQCASAGVPYFFKQWGEFAPDDPAANHTTMIRVGRARAGRLLDGREHNDLPWSLSK